MKLPADIFRPGHRVNRSGIYEVKHYREHRSPHQGELLAGEIFPYCKECKTRVRFLFCKADIGRMPSLALDLSFKEKEPMRATAAALFKAAFGRSMTAEEKKKIGSFKDWD